jgi:sodium-coupled neutral amino acid transporter 10
MTMDNASGHTMNLANSIIGVGILAMPYCFKQCGVLLSIFILLISSIISRLACHFLLKSAIIARRKTFEFLAFHIFGTLGKFSIEIGMIGFLLGTCIAFFVVMGDLGPAIISEMFGVRIGNTLRNSTLVALAVFCVLPMGLLKNVDSLNGVSKATIGFYCCLVLKIIIEALPHIFTGDWVSEVVLWRPAGILQCLPIFSMALFCQTQIFEIYQAIPNASLEKMNGLIRVAVNICTWVYIFVGTFGYIAFFQKPFTGNILLSFKPSITSDVIKLGFVLSLAFSFPLVIFPCRASLNSLLYKGPSYTVLHEGAPANYIPEGKFKMLTLVIVSVSLIIALMIPTIELVLGLVGSTIGVMICVLFPVTCFICISPKNTNERILAQIMLFVGVIVMVLGTYANLYAFEEANLSIVTEKIPPPLELAHKLNAVEPEKPVVMDIPTTIKIAISEEKKQNPPEVIPEKVMEAPIAEKVKIEDKEVRHEPPQPEEPVENVVKTPKNEVKVEVKSAEDKQGPVVEPVQPPDEKVEESGKEEVVRVVDEKKMIEEEDGKKKDEGKEMKIGEEKKDVIKEVKKNDEVDIEAIKKEDTELKEQEEKKQTQDRNQILIDTIQKQNEVQMEIVEQQKKLIEVIQKQQESGNNNDLDKVNEEKVKAVKQIESIARKAIESISGQDKNVAKEKKETGEKNKVEDGVKNNQREVVKENGNKSAEEAEKKEKIDDNNMGIVKEVKIDVLKEENQERKNEANKIPAMVPLPIALAKLNNVTVETKEEKINKNKSQDEDANIKTIRRDILSDDDAKKRPKRETNEIDPTKIENLNKAMKDVCDDMNKITSTEKPIIKMLCKLSEPDLVRASDIEAEAEKASLDLKPQKRDLKHFPEK